MTALTRIPLSAPDIGPAERERLLETFDAGWVSSAGPVVEAFEHAFAEATGFAHATAEGRAQNRRVEILIRPFTG